jgi:glucose-1-phosphate adenylyltransferase
LSRKNGGLQILPPYGHVRSIGMYRGRLEALSGVLNFIAQSHSEYVVLSDCDVMTAVDYRPVVKHHINSKADITLVYAKGLYDSGSNSGTIFGFDEEGRVNDVLNNPVLKGECNIGLNMFVMNKAFLEKIVRDSISRNETSFVTHILQDGKKQYRIMGWEHKGYYSRIDSINNYFTANMELLDRSKCTALFTKHMPIYTKVKDSGPVKYGLQSSIKNSFIADGCVIEGTVENSVLFRGVKIGKGSVVKDSLLMPDTVVGENADMSYIITDKCVRITDTKVLTGSVKCPLYIGKKSII